MRWPEFLERRERRAIDARVAAEALRGGDASPAGALLGAWRFVDHPDLLGAGMSALAASQSHPAHRWAALPFAPRSTLTPPAADDLPEFFLRREAGWSCAARVAPEPLAWTVEALAFFGEEVNLRERAAFAARSFPLRAEKDEAARRLWSEWFRTGYADRDRWVKLFAGPVHDAAKSALNARKYPAAVKDRLLGAGPDSDSELSELAFDQLFLGEAALPGWVDVATRVLETAGRSPVDRLARHLDGSERTVASQCAARRGHWADTAALVGGDRDLDRRGDLYAASLQQNPDWAEGLVDLHTALRLIALWSLPGSGDPDDAWTSIRSNRGRARARLRAVIAAGSRDRLRQALLPLESLHARTSFALGRHVYRWFMDNENQDSPPAPGRICTPPCTLDGLAPLPAEDIPAARTWTFLVVLRGQLPRLRRWVRTGSTGDRDSRWGELLTEDLPAVLRDPGGAAARDSGYRRLRAWLAVELPMLLERELPRIAALAALHPKSAKAGGLELLRAEWDARVPIPAGGFPAIVAAAQELLTELGRADAEEEG